MVRQAYVQSGRQIRVIEEWLSFALGTRITSTIASMRQVIIYLSVVGTLLSNPGRSIQAQTLFGPSVQVSLAPYSVSLKAGESAQFSASVTGTKLPGVTWALVPPVGTLANGVYTAPATINAPQAVTVMATSLADPTKVASATVWLVVTVAVAVTPSTVSLTAGQSAQFNASIAGALNTSVSWSLTPPVGTIVNGTYTAPVTVETLQTILLTVASLADPSKTAQASITLTPSLPTSISISPSQLTLPPSGTQQFTATVLGGKAAVVWSLSPMVGNISPSGLYTAPSAVSQAQSVTIRAGIATDPTKTASAIITLTAQTPPPPLPPIQLPVEVVGLDGKIVTIPFNIPVGSNVSGALTLSMRIHGLRFDAQASVQVNNAGWQPISTANVTLQGNAAGYGGIGGGFSTLKMTMALPAGRLTTGMNTVSFRFNGTDGRVSGFRVLSFNFLDPSSNPLLPAAAFVYEDPNTWQPPSSLASDISAGKTLYYTAPLTKPTPGGPVAILAHCTDCHAQDGRDLKYFNYSNNSIRTRAMFHGLTAAQGDQIASYVRTLNVVNPGRPWNPPYQPGPGLDEQPVINWSAGAGIDGVLNTDQDMLNAMFPGGIQNSFFLASGNLNVRETPIDFQLPDWNQWLPGTAPVDGLGSLFTSSTYLSIYHTIRAGLNVSDPVAYAAQKLNFTAWNDAYYGIMQTYATPIANSSQKWTASTADAMYSAAQWGMVKQWELMNEFQLEGFAQNIFGSTQADQRAWYSQQPFRTSPHMMQMATDGSVPGLRNSSYATVNYLAFVWYHLQLVLNNSNKQQLDHGPIDWGYTYGYIKNMALLVQPQAALQTLWLTKALQISNNGQTPAAGIQGWQFTVNDASQMVHPEANLVEWKGVAAATRIAISTGYIQAWLAQVTQFTPAQFYTGNWASPTEDPSTGSGDFGSWVWYMIPRYKYLGVDPSIMTQVAQWAQTVWPVGNWTADLNQTCYAPNITYDGVVDCH